LTDVAAAGDSAMVEKAAIPKELRALHACNRLAFGPRPGDLENINRIGTEHWIEQQLHPATIPEPAALVSQIGGLETLRMTPVDLFIRYGPPMRAGGKPDPDAQKAARQRAQVVVDQTVQARLYRAIAGPRQLQEVMAAFWFNHFNVFAGKGLCYLWAGAYEEEAIRPHTLGRFRDLLGATAKHPAMLFYLDNWQNTAPGSPGSWGKLEGINENYARELMELHTLGVNGGYSQQDVIALAQILTGWGIVRRENFLAGFFRRRRGFGEEGAVRTAEGFYFDPSRHDFSDKTLLGERIRGGGISEGERALDLLARHPTTARHLSYQLAQYFVADDPPRELVERMSARYQASDGNIREVLETLFTSAEFWDQRVYAAKFKTPYEFVISAARATGLPVRNVRPLLGTMAGLGMPPYGCQTPDGYKNTQPAWLNPDAMMIRLSFATGLGAGRLPLDRIPDDASDDTGRLAAGRGMRRIILNHNGAESAPPDPMALANTLGGRFSANTAAAVEAAPDRLRAPLILGSPDFMMR
jgi:uncharacterized protein (DUF1800 family)